MKLPDFSFFAPLVQLRQSMGAHEQPDMGEIPWERLRLQGLDIPLEDVVPDHEDTLTYQGRRVILYIRDHYTLGGSYKYHVAECGTIRGMRGRDLFSRYVVTTRVDGLFIINHMDRQTKQILQANLERRLEVCINCLKQLDWDGYKGASGPARKQLRATFNPAQFFDVYSDRPSRWQGAPATPTARARPPRREQTSPPASSAPPPELPGWAASITPVHRRVVLHISKHGAITEAEATAMLGGARQFRRFSRAVDHLNETLPFTIRADGHGQSKRFLKSR